MHTEDVVLLTEETRDQLGTLVPEIALRESVGLNGVSMPVRLYALGVGLDECSTSEPETAQARR